MVRCKESPLDNQRCFILTILQNAGIDSKCLSKLATNAIAQSDNNSQSIAWWFAVLIDNNPKQGIQELENWLSGLNKKTAIESSQQFITTLLGTRFGNSYEINLTTGLYMNPSDLKSLIKIMHSFILIDEDIDRTKDISYTSTHRDDAQDARDRLLRHLADIPGKETYTALQELSQLPALKKLKVGLSERL
ncbi:hypothetical protein [Aliamphritea spongicola]|nr:hypothetical protein [Aliamphritea spongicola]